MHNCFSLATRCLVRVSCNFASKSGLVRYFFQKHGIEQPRCQATQMCGAKHCMPAAGGVSGHSPNNLVEKKMASERELSIFKCHI